MGGVREMTQELRVLNLFADDLRDPGLVSSTHIMTHNCL